MSVENLALLFSSGKKHAGKNQHLLNYDHKKLEPEVQKHCVGIYNKLAKTDTFKRQINRYIKSQRALCKSRQGIELRYRLTSPLVTGTGIDGALETGFLFHPLLNIPYLPGSSVKGLLGAFSKLWAGQFNEAFPQQEGSAGPAKFKPRIHWKLFGEGEENADLIRALIRQDKEDSQSDHGPFDSMGGFTFLDAIPEPPKSGQLALIQDILTPHGVNYADRSTLKKTPKILKFLTLAEGAEISFFMFPTSAYAQRLDDEAEEEPAEESNRALGQALGLPLSGHDEHILNSDKEVLASWLDAALRFMGAGARTKGGRGRFERI